MYAYQHQERAQAGVAWLSPSAQYHPIRLHISYWLKREDGRNSTEKLCKYKQSMELMKTPGNN